MQNKFDNLAEEINVLKEKLEHLDHSETKSILNAVQEENQKLKTDNEDQQHRVNTLLLLSSDLKTKLDICENEIKSLLTALRLSLHTALNSKDNSCYLMGKNTKTIRCNDTEIGLRRGHLINVNSNKEDESGSDRSDTPNQPKGNTSKRCIRQIVNGLHDNSPSQSDIRDVYLFPLQNQVLMILGRSITLIVNLNEQLF